MDNFQIQGDKDFYIEITAATPVSVHGGIALIGAKKVTRVKIKDDDGMVPGIFFVDLHELFIVIYFYILYCKLDKDIP